jgi:hypothetical protein
MSIEIKNDKEAKKEQIKGFDGKGVLCSQKLKPKAKAKSGGV